MNAAVSRGDTGLVRYLRDHGCPWDESSCVNAALIGNVEMLIFLRENGCPWDYNTWYHAERVGALCVLAYAKANGCPDSDAALIASDTVIEADR